MYNNYQTKDSNAATIQNNNNNNGEVEWKSNRDGEQTLEIEEEVERERL